MPLSRVVLPALVAASALVVPAHSCSTSSAKTGTVMCVATKEMGNATWTRAGMTASDHVGSSWVEHSSCAPPDLVVTPAGHAWAMQSGDVYFYPSDATSCSGQGWIPLPLPPPDSQSGAVAVCGTDGAAVAITASGTVLSRRNVSLATPAGTAWNATNFSSSTNQVAATCAMSPAGSVWIVDRVGGVWFSLADPTGAYAKWTQASKPVDATDDGSSSSSSESRAKKVSLSASVLTAVSGNDAGQVVAIDSSGKLWLRRGISSSVPAGTTWEVLSFTGAVGVAVSVAVDSAGTMWIANTLGAVLTGVLGDGTAVSLQVVSTPGDGAPACASVSASFGRPAPPLSLNVLPAPACVTALSNGSTPSFVDFPDGVNFKWVPVGANQPACDVLTAALNRYTRIIASGASPLDTAGDSATAAAAAVSHRAASEAPLPIATVVEVRVDTLVASPRPSDGMDESYTLLIGTDGGAAVTLSSATVWGALRGLETLSQLAKALPGETSWVVPAPASPARRFPAVNVTDWPRFSYRGLMVDPARRYLPMSALEAVVDSMAYTKLNVSKGFFSNRLFLLRECGCGCLLLVPHTYRTFSLG
jgi:hypothetical protein